MKPIPSYGHLMTVKEYVKAVKSNCFIDYDGYGYYASKTEMSEEIAIPSETFQNGPKSGFPYVVWFNR